MKEEIKLFTFNFFTQNGTFNCGSEWWGSRPQTLLSHIPADPVTMNMFPQYARTKGLIPAGVNSCWAEDRWALLAVHLLRHTQQRRVPESILPVGHRNCGHIQNTQALRHHWLYIEKDHALGKARGCSVEQLWFLLCFVPAAELNNTLVMSLKSLSWF